MMRRIMFGVATLVLVATVAFAGKDFRRSVKQAPAAVDDGNAREAVHQEGRYVPGNDNAAVLTWVAVDSMANAFGPASTRVRPISYDQATNVVTLIHRGAAPYTITSGQLWYNMSRNGGATWRRVGELNGGTALSCRYPTGAIINPANNADTSQCFYVWIAPNLEIAPNTWGYYSYGVDFPLGGGAGNGVVDNNDMGTNSAAGSIWGINGSPWILWAATMGATTAIPNDSRNWRTNDYVSIPTQIPPTWTDAPPNFENAISFLPGMGNSTGHYFGMHGLFGGDTLANAFNGGYSKSTDNGATWSQWVRPQPDWMIATGLPPRYDLFDYVQPPGGTVSWNSDMVIDGNGRGHFFHVVVDSPWTTHDPRGIVEILQTATGWEYKWIRNPGTMNTYTGLGYPSTTSGTNYLQQTNNGIRGAISADGTVMAVIWLDAGTLAPADSFPDIWFSYRTLSSSAWSTPENLTQTSNFPELLLHAAPTLKHNGGNSYTMFIGRSYQSNINTYPPDNGLKTTFFVAAHTFTATGTSVGESGQPTAFKLAQNYPNPFNPSTTIEYTIAERAHVKLSVFNVLGQEVASLVNDVKEAGVYEVPFSATNLTSGVYFYTLKAGSFSETRKMVLLK